MKKCIQNCDGVTDTSQTAPAAATSASTGTDSSVGASATDMADSDENGAPAAAVQQIMVVGMASVAGFAVMFL